MMCLFVTRDTFYGQYQKGTLTCLVRFISLSYKNDSIILIIIILLLFLKR